MKISGALVDVRILQSSKFKDNISISSRKRKMRGFKPETAVSQAPNNFGMLQARDSWITILQENKVSIFSRHTINDSASNPVKILPSNDPQETLYLSTSLKVFDNLEKAFLVSLVAQPKS